MQRTLLGKSRGVAGGRSFPFPPNRKEKIFLLQQEAESGSRGNPSSPLKRRNSAERKSAPLQARSQEKRVLWQGKKRETR